MSSERLIPAPSLKPISSISSFHERPDRLGYALTAVWLLGPATIGVCIGSFISTKGEPCSGLPPAVERLSTILGWTYFAAWSISFYPQVWLNFRRRSVVGLSLDFQILNMVGFVCYAAYNSALYWSPVVRRQYADSHGGTVPAVHANDVFFALHAAALTAVTLLQCALLDRGGQRPSRVSVLGTAAVALVAAVYAAGVAACGGGCWSGVGEALPWLHRQLSWLGWLYFLSFVKLGISLVKYIPQVVLNHRRKSTQGWNIWNVLLDFEGGSLSLAQLLMDSGVTKDWTPVTGNPVKFGLGFASMFFDVIFMVQHYILYRGTAPSPPSGECAQEGCSERGEMVDCAPAGDGGSSRGQRYERLYGDECGGDADGAAESVQQGEDQP